MDQDYIQKLQNRIIELYKSHKEASLSKLAEDQCSEASRLLAYWMLDENSDAELIILKGTGVSDITDKCHDILLVKEEDDFTMIDPSIWQFYPDAESIFVGIVSNIEEAREKAAQKYGGQWEVSERITESKPELKKEMKDIIKANIDKL